MDSSIFPTASGSNPMVTVLTLAYMLSSRLALSLKYHRLTNEQQQTHHNKDVPLSRTKSSRKVLSTADYTKAQQLIQKRINLRSQGFPIIARNPMSALIAVTPIVTIFLVLLWLFSFLGR
jgi:hypothetical protein